MPQQQAPFLEGKYGWNFGESGWDTGMNENLLKFSFMFDGNVDSIVASLPPVSNGAAHFNSADNRFYFGVGTVWYSSPCPKSFIFKIKSNGDFYQFNGTSAVKIDSPSETDSRLSAVELTLSSLGTAAFQNVEDFATQAELDVVEGQAQGYTDALRDDIANPTDPAKGAGLVGRSVVVVSAINELLSAAAVDDKAYAVSSYYPGALALTDNSQVSGGGTFKWAANVPKSAHNGGTVISNTVPWDGSEAGLPGFLAGTGETTPAGTGCFLRVFSGALHAEFFGANTSLANNAPSINKALSVHTCILPAKTLTCTSDIIIPPTIDPLIPNGVSLTGQGSYSKLIMNGCQVLALDGTYFALKDFTVARIGSAGPAIRVGLDGSQTIANRRLLMDNVRIDSSTGDGILFQEGWIATLINPIIQRCEDVGLHIIQGTIYGASWNGITLVGGEIQGNRVGMMCEVTKGVYIQGTAIEGNTQHGLWLKGTNRDVSILSYFEANGTSGSAYHDLYISDNDTANATPYNIRICGGTGFLRGTTGTTKPVNIQKGIHVTVEDGVSFFGYADNAVPMITVGEPVTNTTKGAFGVIRTDCPSSFVCDITARSFGRLQLHTFSPNLVATDSSLTEASFGIGSRIYYGRFLPSRFYFTAGAAGDVVLRVTFIDSATGSAIGSLASLTVPSVSGFNTFQVDFDMATRNISGKNVIVKVGRDGAAGGDTTVGNITLHSFSLGIRQQIGEDI
jgi:hypothetical protein